MFQSKKTPLFANAIYVMFKKKPNCGTNYDNLLFKTLQLNCCANGDISSEPETSYEPVFYEVVNSDGDQCCKQLLE